MADIPVPRSYPQILGDQIDAFLSNQGVKNLRVGGPILSFLEASAQGNLRSSQDIFSLLNSIALDNATGLALARIGADERVPKITERPATGVVDIGDSSFVKVSTRIFQGKPAPIVGSISIDVVDASLLPDPDETTVKIYIGRGTGNYEGPLTVAAVTNNGTYWTLLLASPTVKFHNVGDEVVLAQGGNRIVQPSSIVKTPQANLSDAVEFKVLYGATIPDGETDAKGVLVVCQKPGEIGNVPARAIKEFSTQPFPGATVINLLPYSNGVETENDDDYRERIKNVRQSRTQGTSLAITTAVTGIIATDENKRVVSASLVRRAGFPSTLFVDDGTGYEERSLGVSIETLVDSATGGEQFFQTTRRPISKAFVTSRNSAPFTLTPGCFLSVRVGGVLYTHSFDAALFSSISNASVFEVVASINGNQSLGFAARTADGGTKVVLFAKGDSNEEIQVVAPEDGDDSNEAFRFPGSTVYSLLVYKNDRLLHKDGRAAKLASRHHDEWNTVAGDQTLTVAVDGTPELTYTFTDQDFVDAATGFVAVGRNTPAAWAKVINAKIPGLTATVEGARVLLTSNAGPVAKSAIEISGGTLVSERFFPADEVHGVSRDYTVDRNYGQIRMETVLDDGDRLSIGSANTRSFVESAVVPTTSLADDIRGWFVVDGDARIVEHGVGTSTPVEFSVKAVHDWGLELAIDTPIDAFKNVQAGDWLLFWDSEVPSSLLGAHRISTAADSRLIIERRQSVTARAGHQASVMVPSGANISRVLVTGGYTMGRLNSDTYSAPGTTDSCEIFDPNTQLATKVAPMGWRRAFHTATPLDDGRVLVTGGMYDDPASTTSNHTWLDTTEIYDPDTDTWTPGPALAQAVSHHRAIKLADGKVAIIGGLYRDEVTGILTYSGKIDVFDPFDDSITHIVATVTARARHGLALMLSGNVMVVSGETTGQVVTTSVEIFNPSGAGAVGPGVNVDVGRRDFGISKVNIDDVVIAGGDAADPEALTFSLFATGSWSASANIDGPNAAFSFQDLVFIQDEVVLMLGAYDPTTNNAPRTYEFDGVSAWTPMDNSLLNIDQTYYDGRQYALLYKDDDSYENHVLAIGGRNTWTNLPSATVEQFNYDDDAQWSCPEPAVESDVLLGSRGMAIVRSSRTIQEVTIPAGDNYTAGSLVSQLNDQLRGATASVYRTNRYRVRTNTFGLDGDIALVAQDSEDLKLDVGDAIVNLTGHYGSVETANSEFGTPSFDDTYVYGQDADVSELIADALTVNAQDFSGGYGLVGLKSDITGHSPSQYHKRFGNNVGFFGHVHSFTQYAVSSLVNVRETPIQPWMPHDRLYLAAPYAIGPNDDLTVQVDNNPNKRFPIKMWRKLKPGTSTYGASNTFKDAEVANASLATTFGLNYDFNDFAVYMKARAVAYTDDETLKMLFRYYRFGADGNEVRVRFSSPEAAEADLAVSITQNAFGFDAAQVEIQLPSGAEKPVTVNTGTRLGVAIGDGTRTGSGHAELIFLLGFAIASAARTSNVTTATLQLPNNVSTCGLTPGDRVYINSTDSNFDSGRYTILSVGVATGTGGTQNITYAESNADIGSTANVGTLTNDDSGELLFQGLGLQVDDFFHLKNWGSFNTSTFVISAIGPQYLVCKSGNESIIASADDGVVSWTELSESDAVTAFTNPKKTADEIVTDINTKAGEENSGWPITAVILGDGTGELKEPTSDTLIDPEAWFTLVDGLNWVSLTDSPISLAGDYELTFKKAVDGSLATGTDWINEEVRIVPITAAGVVRWLNTPCVSGLFTAATIEASSSGTKVQITTRTPGGNAGVQVQGGLANSLTAAVVGSVSGFTGVSTIKKNDATGLSAGMWCRITNQVAQPKLAVLDSSTQLVSWSADGLIELNTPVYTDSIESTEVRLVWEKQGNFIAIRDPGVLNPSDDAPAGAVAFSVSDGDFIKIDSGEPGDGFESVPVQNQGIFRVVKVDTTGTVPNSAGTIWIENPDAVEGAFVCTIRGFSSDSTMPGDKLVITTNAWGEKNRGTWLIEKVGVNAGGDSNQFSTTTKLKVSTTNRAPQPVSAGPLGGEVAKIRIVEGVPLTLFKQIVGICINPDDASHTDIRWDTASLISFVNAGAGSVIAPIDKLGFSTELSSGVDGYNYGIGLIGEANKVVYGDPSDTATYPGVAAAGAEINISGPHVRRVQIALNLRIKSGATTSGGGTASDIADRVRSAVATVVNQTPLGKSVAIGALVAAAQKVPGVVAVSVLSPLYAVGKDVIPVQPFEKALVLNLEQDIGITFSGE